MHRRSLLTGLGSIIAAPVIVSYTSLMPVRRIILTPDEKYPVPAGFDEYEASMWRKLMQIAWVLDIKSRPHSDDLKAAIRTGIVPWLYIPRKEFPSAY